MKTDDNDNDNEDECYWKCGRPYELLVWLQLEGIEYDIPMKVCEFCYEMIVDPHHIFRTEKRKETK